jgi:trehalose-phosphatase
VAKLELPRGSVLSLDVDGCLADTVTEPAAAVVRPEVPALLDALAKHFKVIVISGRPVVEVRDLVRASQVIYYGLGGLQLLVDGRPWTHPMAVVGSERVQRFADEVRRRPDVKGLGVYFEDRRYVVAVHWRGVEDDEAAAALAATIAEMAREAGVTVKHARQALDFGPGAIDKGMTLATYVTSLDPRPPAAAHIGDDESDAVAHRALCRLVADGLLDRAAVIGVRSDETPASILRCDGPHPPGIDGVLVDGVDGVVALLLDLLAAAQQH